MEGVNVVMDDIAREVHAAVRQKVLIVTLGSMIASVGLTIVLRAFAGEALLGAVPNLVISAFVPAVVAPLGTWRVIEMSERLRIANDHLRVLSETDPLTRALNRRRFVEIFTAQISLAERHDYPTSVLLIDFDHFKQINDRHGHGVGDQVLIESSAAIHKLCRESDAFARFGGEEFVLLLPHTALDGAEMVAERVLEALRQLVIHDPISGEPIDLKVTASIGGVTSETSRDQIDHMLSAADNLLYEAKNTGRDRYRIEGLHVRPPAPAGATSAAQQPA